jgi:hypothetical protein
MLRGIHRITAQCASEPLLYFCLANGKNVFVANASEPNRKRKKKRTQDLFINSNLKNDIFAAQMNRKNVARHTPEDCAVRI